MSDNEVFKTVEQAYRVIAEAEAKLAGLRAQHAELLAKSEDTSDIAAQIAEGERLLDNIKRNLAVAESACDAVIKAEEDLREKRADAIKAFRNLIAYAKRHYPDDPRLPEWEAQLAEYLQKEREDQ